MLFHDPSHTNFYHVLILFLSQLNHVMNNLIPLLGMFMYVCGYKNYKVKSRETIILIKNNTSKYDFFSNIYNENNEPCGTLIHKSIIPKFIIYECSEGFAYFNIICSKETFKQLTKQDYTKKDIDLDENYIPIKEQDKDKDTSDGSDDEEFDELNKKISYITRTGEYGYFQYKIRYINLNHMSAHNEITMYSHQEKLFKSTMNFYKTNNFCKIYLNGNPGCGKTYFGYILAQKLGCYLCDCYNPYEPSSNLNEIYHSCRLKPEKPLILILDEVDILLEKIHNKTTEGHKKYSREIYDKTTWNNFMDKIEFGLYPYLIIIMNSNKQKAYIDNMDASYLRQGRINIIDEW